MYYIASLVKFGNFSSMVCAHRQGQWKAGRMFSFSFSDKAAKMLCIVYIVFLDMIFYPRVVQ